MAGMAVPIVQKAWDGLTKICSSRLLRAVIHPYFWFNPAVIQFQRISSRLDGFVPLNGNKLFLKQFHLCRDQMESMPAQETGHQKSMKPLDVFHIRCWRTFTSLFPTTCCIASLTNYQGWTGLFCKETVFPWCSVRFRSSLRKLCILFDGDRRSRM